MEPYILISYLNDFIFCPASIYCHQLYGKLDILMYQNEAQLNGTAAHAAVDLATYSTKKNILQGIEIYCEKYKICGKIDIFDLEKGILVERKRSIKKIYDGYVFQVYAQYYALKEMGYDVREIKIHSINTNKNYQIELPENDNEMKIRFENLINEINEFSIEKFQPTNKEKCVQCIYEPACHKSLIC